MGLVVRTFKVDEGLWGEFMKRCRREGTTASAAIRALVDGSGVPEKRKGRVRAAKPEAERVVGSVAAAPTPSVPTVVPAARPFRSFPKPGSK